MKKIVKIFLMFGIIITFVSVLLPWEVWHVEAGSNMSLTQLESKFPNGKYWNHAGNSANNPDGYTSTPCNHHGNCSKNNTDYSGWCGCNSFGNSIQCFGFANKLAYDAFGSTYTSWSRTSLTNVKPGDVIRYKNNRHSIFVTGVSGEVITYGDCNSDEHCKIRWGATISKSTVSATLTAVYSAPFALDTENSEQPNPDNPVGGCTITGKVGGITVTGWTYDKNNKAEQLDVHVYIGGSVGTGEGFITKANAYRPDVPISLADTSIGEYHGIDDVFYTNQTGQQDVYVYAINVGNGENTLLKKETVNIETDTTPPGIQNVVVSDINNTGYTVTCKVSDNAKVMNVILYTWHESQNASEAHQYKNLTIQDGVVTCRVNTNDWGGKDGKYVTHIYAYDVAGNNRGYPVEVNIDNTPPVISEVKVIEVNNTGYTVTCKVSDNTKIEKVKFPSWHDSKDASEAIWYEGVYKDGTATCKVSVSELGNLSGIYHTHIYAYDEFGNYTGYPVSTDIDTTLSEKNEGELSITNASAVVGGITEVYINLKNNPGIVGATLAIEYDKEKLQLISCEDLGVLNDYQFSDLEHNPFLLNWEDPLATVNNIGNGNIAKLQFRILKDLGEEGADLNLSIDTAYDVNIEDVLFHAISGKVTMQQYKPGDVNNDNTINSKDSILLRKYVLGGSGTIDKSTADVNKDGTVNSKDSIILRKYVLGADVELK